MSYNPSMPANQQDADNDNYFNSNQEDYIATAEECGLTHTKLVDGQPEFIGTKKAWDKFTALELDNPFTETEPLDYEPDCEE